MASRWSSKTPNCLRIVELSDIHLGHPHTKAANIVERLKAGPFSEESLAKADLVVIAGDLWDRLLKTNDEDYQCGLLMLLTLCQRCQYHRVVCRILEGTTLHDNHQSRLLDTLVNGLRSKNPDKVYDVAYVRDLSIEHIDALGIDVLYVPDNLGDAAPTFSRVRELMDERRLEAIDFAFMHGQFRYQMPEVADRGFVHREEDYLGVVRHQIFIGHHHTFSQFDRIVASGSFDRLGQNEEGAKGHVVYDLFDDHQWRITHVHNENAQTYKTLQITKPGLEQSLAEIGKLCAKMEPGAILRLQLHRTHPLVAQLSDVPRLFPSWRWSAPKILEEQETADVRLWKKEEEDHVSLDINPKTVAGLLEAEFSRLGASEESRRRALLILETLR